MSHEQCGLHDHNLKKGKGGLIVVHVNNVSGSWNRYSPRDTARLLLNLMAAVMGQCCTHTLAQSYAASRHIALAEAW